MAKGYSIKEFTTGSGGDAGYGTEYALVDPDGNRVAGVAAYKDDDGNIINYFIDSGSEGYSNIVPVDLDAINAKAAKGNVPFGTGMGPALGYEYGMKNSEGDIFRKFDKDGNLTEYLDQHGVFQKASDFKPTGMIFNPMTGNLETAYTSPNSKRVNITESNATSVNPYHEDQGGWLGEGGWGNIARLVVAGLTANPALMASVGVSSSVASAIGNVAIGVADGKSFGEALLDGVKSGAISAATSGILQGINADGVENVAANWEDAVNNGSFADAAVNFSNNYIAPVVESGGKSFDAVVESGGKSFDAVVESGGKSFDAVTDVGLPGSDMSFQDLLEATGLSEAEKTSIPTDADFTKYIERYPDLVSAGIDTPEEAVRHYLDYGKTEGRDVSSSGPVTTAPTAPDTGTTDTGTTDTTETEVQADEVDPIATPLINELTTRVEKYQAEGKSRDDAITQSILDLSNSSTANKNELISLISSGDQELLDALGETTEELTGQITNLGTDLGGQITTVGGQVTDLTKDFGDYRTEEEEKEKRKRGKEALDYFTQSATTTVKTPEVAKIDYMYDIGGDSLFATPKQESLMPSPYEDNPEPVEGAMPRYQYYAPGGGYTYADGGLIGSDDMQTINDLYEMIRSK